MDIDAETARALGWPKLKYAFIERERRWLCQKVPEALVIGAEHITASISPGRACAFARPCRRTAARRCAG